MATSQTTLEIPQKFAASIRLREKSKECVLVVDGTCSQKYEKVLGVDVLCKEYDISN